MQDITFPYRIFAVDPATGKSGWSVLDVMSLQPLRIVIVAHGELDGEKLYRQNKEMSPLFGRQFCVVSTLHAAYIQLIQQYQPRQVVSEGTYGHLHMSAVMSLLLAIHELRRASQLVLGKDIAIIPPTISKLAFTGKGGADKDLMRWGYRTHDYLEGKVLDDQISEHEIDSIAHGVGHVKRDLTGEVVQISAKEKKAAKRERQKKALEKQKEKTG